MERLSCVNKLFPEQTIPVERVDIESFEKKVQEQYPHWLYVVETGEYVQRPIEWDTVNTAAGPCLILWAFDHRYGRYFSGHFPRESKEDCYNYFKRLPTENHPSGLQLVKNRDVIRQVNIFHYYWLMINDLRHAASLVDDLEIYLFGENLCEGYYETEAERAPLNYGVIKELIEIGVRPTKIFDYRHPELERGDSTIFDAKHRRILHYVN